MHDIFIPIADAVNWDLQDARVGIPLRIELMGSVKTVDRTGITVTDIRLIEVGDIVQRVGLSPVHRQSHNRPMP